MHNGYAVVDLETTGFSPRLGHRIVELGIVHVDPSGRIEREMETLLDPGRDVGPSHIHRIEERDVRGAPAFELVAADVADALRGRVLVAHNVQFEATFLQAEFGSLGADVPISKEQAICTMRLAKGFLPGQSSKLVDCCAAYGIEIRDAHEALSDARATAQLLAAYMQNDPGHVNWAGWGAHVASFRWPSLEYHGAPWVARSR